MELKNKTILFLGSSVTYGWAAGGVSFVDVIQDVCECNCIKAAVSGTTLADVNEKSYVARLKSIDEKTKVDLFVCQLSTNDATKKIEIHKIEAAILFILEHVKKVFGCPVVFYTGTRFDSDEYKQMIALLYRLKNELEFEILDLFYDEDMAKISREDYQKYMRDPIHPTLLGYTNWWAPKFIDFLKKL